MPGSSDGSTGHRKQDLWINPSLSVQQVLTKHLLYMGTDLGPEVIAGKTQQSPYFPGLFSWGSQIINKKFFRCKEMPNRWECEEGKPFLNRLVRWAALTTMYLSSRGLAWGVRMCSYGESLPGRGSVRTKPWDEYRTNVVRMEEGRRDKAVQHLDSPAHWRPGASWLN